MSSLLAPLTACFDLLLRSTLQASVLIVLILTLRLLFARRLPGRWLYALWVVLLIRLALPWTPQSSASLYRLLPDLAQFRTHATAATLPTPIGSASPVPFNRGAPADFATPRSGNSASQPRSTYG